MKIEDLLLEEEKQESIESDKEPCKGLVFRGRSNIFYSYKQGRIVRHDEIRLLRRQSCHGCKECSWLHEVISDSISMNSLAFPNEIEDGALYGIQVHTSRDWESGIEDIDYLEIVKR